MAMLNSTNKSIIQKFTNSNLKSIQTILPGSRAGVIISAKNRPGLTQYIGSVRYQNVANLGSITGDTTRKPRGVAFTGDYTRKNKNIGTAQVSHKFEAPADWRDPDILAHFTEIAPGWYESENVEGRKFYYSKEANKTQWKHPFSGEVSKPPEYKRMAQVGVLEQWKKKNKLKNPHPGQIAYDDPQVDNENTPGTNKGYCIINANKLWQPDDPRDRMGMLQSHGQPFEQVIQHKSIEMPFQTNIIDDRPRRLPNRIQKTGKALWYIQCGIFFLCAGWFPTFYRLVIEYWGGYTQSMYPLNQFDRNSCYSEYWWLLGVWSQEDIDYKS